MARRTATVIIGPHLLVREALESLIKNYRYRVVCSVGSIADIENSTADDGPKLVILGAESTDNAIAEAVSIRKLWSNSKIVLLFEHTSVADFQKLLTSEVDGCVPLFASPETLIRTLDLVTIEDARVVITANARNPAIRPSPTRKSGQPQAEGDGISPGNTQRDTRAINVVNMPAKPTVNRGRAAQSNGNERDAHWTASRSSTQPLSPREKSIMQCLIAGDSNKSIARKIDIAEATVKVHVKAILRKIRVQNRTQAAIWGMNNGSLVRPIFDVPSPSEQFPDSPSIVSDIKQIEGIVRPELIHQPAHRVKPPTIGRLIRNGTAAK